MFYVYVFEHFGVPFYVGKGQKNRFFAHLERKDFPPLDEITVAFIPCATEDEALAKEASLIRSLGIKRNGGALINKVIPSRNDHKEHALPPISRLPKREATPEDELFLNLTAMSKRLKLSVYTLSVIMNEYPNIRSQAHRPVLYHFGDVKQAIQLRSHRIRKERSAKITAENRARPSRIN